METNILKISFNKHETIAICVISKNAENILQYILNEEVTSEYLKIQASLFERLHINTLYQKVKGTKSIYEMRFTNKKRNDRIYCKQVTKGKTLYIILEILYTKKTQDIPKRIFSQLKKIDKNEYNI